MFKKTKKFWNKIEPLVFLVATFILFLLISLIIFIYSKNAQVFKNNLLNLIVLIIFYTAVYSFLISLYYKILKFTLMKPILLEKEFNHLIKKRIKIAKQIKEKLKDEKYYNSKDFKQKYGQTKKIEKKLNENSVSFESWFLFVIFSMYFGLWTGNFFWAIKHSSKNFFKTMKNFITIKTPNCDFRWYKFKNLKGKEMYVINSYVPKKIIKK